MERSHLKTPESNAIRVGPCHSAREIRPAKFGPQINFRQKPFRNGGPSFRLAQFGSSSGHQKTSRGRRI
jgi:hypothetical protein